MKKTDILAENAKRPPMTASPFERGTRVGYSFLNIKTGDSVFLAITEYKEMTNKEGKTNPFWEATNRITGEMGLIFIDGGLRGQLSSMGGPAAVVGKNIEIIHEGYVDATINGETQEVNKYSVYMTLN